MTGILIAVFPGGLSGTLNSDRTQLLADPVGIRLITEKKITTSHSTISSPLCQVLQMHPAAPKLPNFSEKRETGTSLFFKPKGRCYSVIWYIKSMSLKLL